MRKKKATPTQTIARLNREKKRLKKLIHLFDVDSVHTCHEKCPRGACVARRMLWKLKEEKDAYKKVAEHYKTKSAGFNYRIDFLECKEMWSLVNQKTKARRKEEQENKFKGI